MRAHQRTAQWLIAVVVTACACTPAPPPGDTGPTVDASAAAQALDQHKHSSATASKLPGGRTAYRTYAEVGGDLAELASARPDVVERISLPHRTLQGLDVVGVEITHDVTAPDRKPVLLVTGAHHGDEWATVEVAVEFATDLAQRDGRDRRVTALLDRVRVIVVPVVNPDGFQLSRAGTVPDKRRNCRVADPATRSCATSPRTGVDLNRNYGVDWGGVGASADEATEDYRGGAPFSEPETRNVRDLVAGHQVTVFTSLHSHAAMVLRPPGQDATPDTADEAAYAAVGQTLADANGYRNSRSRDLYENSGTAVEWFHHTTGGFGFDVELAGDRRHATFQEGVIDDYLGTRAQGVRETLVRAVEAAANREHHSVLVGTSPPGAVLTLRKTVTQRTAAGTPFTDDLRTTTTSPGAFEWDVNPSTRGTHEGTTAQESWTLDCARGDGTVLQSQQVTIGRGDRAEVDLAECARRWPA
ncbi:M14 family zinc carboxypeptidase [Umezawaea endophytica]|uniref:M14 family zinc carboxypeptidase n=1 Tax=Umezawaea endophytica TaxID=1654476 RepID=A0A9X2VIS9_9PSEU|nr:M14 family zinc carboxypeptidase [Umezawaea endophytica]MCS7477485.1 M14 family zinc carboxypeptidase [Umezawaea endophytica]